MTGFSWAIDAAAGGAGAVSTGCKIEAGLELIGGAMDSLPAEARAEVGAVVLDRARRMCAPSAPPIVAIDPVSYRAIPIWPAPPETPWP